MKKHLIPASLLIMLLFATFSTSSAFLMTPEGQTQYDAISAQMAAVEREQQALQQELEASYPHIVSISGDICGTDPLIVRNLFGSFYVVTDPWNGGVFGNVYSGTHQVSGYTTVSYGNDLYSAMVLDEAPAEALQLSARINELDNQYNTLFDAQVDLLAGDQAGWHARYVAPYVDRYTESDATVIFQIGNPFLYFPDMRYNMETGVYDEWAMLEQDNWAAVPYIRNGSTMIPIRPLIEALGGTVSWDGGTQCAFCTLNSKKITLPVGSATVDLNGVNVPITVPIELTNEKTCVPLRFISENLGAEVEWVPDGQFILIWSASEDSGTEEGPNIPLNFILG